MACTANTMTDKNNCGRCGHVCESASCSDGYCDPVLVLDVPFRPTGFLYAVWLSGGKVFEWEYTTEPTDPHFYVLSAPAPQTFLTAASTGTILQDVMQNPNPNLNMSAVAFDSTYVYEAEPGATTGGVSRKKLDGTDPTGAATPLFALPGNDPGAPASGSIPARPASSLRWKGLVVEGNTAYIAGTTTANGSAWPHDDVTILFAMSPFPATASTVATKMTGLDKLGYVFTDLTVASGHLFWYDNSLDSSKRTLFTVPVTGGTPVAIEDDVFAADHSSIAADATHVYWTMPGALGELKRCPLSNLTAAAATHVCDIESSTEGLALDETHAYFMTTDSFKTVHRVPKAGGTIDDLGSMVLPPSHVGNRMHAVDAKFVYVSDDDGNIFRLDKAP
jgi:hypothetical protein